jgi:meso-butanediol dehydrogenase / (S,S)-butanediol dehydrogenase / diacetyl reductase
VSGFLHDQGAIVTGAARGIGRATALRLAQEGAHVVIADTNLAGAEAAAAAIGEFGTTGFAIQADVTRAADRERIVASAIDHFGQIDILVNNAGIMRTCELLEANDEDWDRVMDVNVRAVFFLSQLAARQMVRQRHGRIINVASAAAKIATNPHVVSYNCSKAAVVALTRTFGVSLAPHGIRVNAVCPGLVDTEMWAFFEQLSSHEGGLAPGEYTRSRVAALPIQRMEKPEDVAGVIAFLAGPDSEYMTGQAINVTGGLVTW